MKQNVIIELSTDELSEKLVEETKQYIMLNLSHAVSPLENPNKLKEYRKMIARIKTELRKREMEKELNNNQ